MKLPNNVHFIFILSVQHTGTWFTIEFLQNHPKKPNFSFAHELTPKRINPNLPNIIHEHMHATHFKVLQTGKPIDETIACLLAHSLISKHPTVIPLRDPLLSMVSRQARRPDLEHNYIVEGFSYLAELAARPNVMFLPVDLPMNLAQRTKKLKDLLMHLKLPAADKYVENTAKNWTVHNTAAAKKTHKILKQCYINKDMQSIRKAMPEEYALLKEKEPIIRPFLETQGYVNLPWWD